MREGLHVPQVSSAPQPREEVLVKVQGRAPKLWAAQNPRRQNAVSNSFSHVHPFALIPARSGGGQKLRCCCSSPSPQAALSCLQVSLCGVCLGSAGSRELWPPSATSLVSSAGLTGSSPWLSLLPCFPGTGFLNVRDVPSLRDATPGVKQRDFNGLCELLALSLWNCGAYWM